MTLVAFDPLRSGEKDSIIGWTSEQVYASDYNYTAHRILENFTDMGGHWDRLVEFRNNYDFGPVYPESLKKLAAFLGIPEDSVSGTSTVSLMCYEMDAHSRGENVTMDFNMFYRQPPEENIGYLAHEMFHCYRYSKQGKEYQEWLFSDPFLFAIDRIADEGIADLIDKPDDVPAYFRSNGTSPALIERYEYAYAATPAILERLDGIAVAFMDEEISEQDFKKALRGYFAVGAIPTVCIWRGLSKGPASGMN